MAGDADRAAVEAGITRVLERIARAADASGRRADDVTLVTVSKTVPVERVALAVEAGARDLGENYVQEALQKLDRFGPSVRWHLIGHLQSNKARLVAGRFALVQSVDRESLAAELGRRAAAAGVIQPVLVEVKLDARETKHGVDPARALDLAARVAAEPGLRLDGLMGMAPLDAPGESARPHFAHLRRLFEALPEAHRRVLSMGMTGDLEAAVMEGATMVRVGSAIFGARS